MNPFGATEHSTALLLCLAKLLQDSTRPDNLPPASKSPRGWVSARLSETPFPDCDPVRAFIQHPS